MKKCCPSRVGQNKHEHFLIIEKITKLQIGLFAATVNDCKNHYIFHHFKNYGALGLIIFPNAMTILSNSIGVISVGIA